MEIDALMDLAAAAASKSPNKVRKVGAVILTGDGAEPIAACNTFPAGVADLDWRHEGDGRFVWMEHAERNAIFNAARSRPRAGRRYHRQHVLPVHRLRPRHRAIRHRASGVAGARA